MPIKNPAKGLKRRYVIALFLLSFAIIGSYVTEQFQISKLKSDAAIINIAGRQRMLSQKITKSILVFMQANTPKLKATTLQGLIHDFNQFESTHLKLQGNDTEWGFKHWENTDSIRILYDELNPHFIQLKSRAEILTDNTLDAYSTLSIQELHQASNSFLSTMDKIVNRYERLSKAKLTRLENIEIQTI